MRQERRIDSNGHLMSLVRAPFAIFTGGGGAMRRAMAASFALAVCALGLGLFPAAALAADKVVVDAAPTQRWVTAWSTSQQPNSAPVTVSNTTVRMIARATIPGTSVRIRLDNTFGPAAVTIGKAYVGIRIGGAQIATGWNRQLSFGGSASVTIPAGGSVVSDSASLRVLAEQDLAVSLYVPASNVQPSQHDTAYVTSYLGPAGSGDNAAGESGAAFTATTTKALWLKSIDVWTSTTTSAVVAFGDSITDGYCTGTDAHERWQDLLGLRIDAGAPASGGASELRSVLNEGISGNTVTRANLNPAAESTPGLERLDRDVLSHAGVSHVIVFMGTNDIRREASASQVINGLQELAQRIRAKGIKAYGATIIPRHNSTAWSNAKTAIRNEVNQWIRTSGAFDAVVDFDAVVRDPSNPDRFYTPYNCGDGVHPSVIGHYQMAKGIGLGMLVPGR